MSVARDLVVSPHLDDAVFSVGQWMGGQGGATVVTVFTRVPALDGVPLAEWDRLCGFTTPQEAATTRKREEAAALDVLGCEHVWLEWLDWQYDQLAYSAPEPRHELVVGLLAAELAKLFEQLGPQRVLIPAGLTHPDHRLASDAAWLACRSLPKSVRVGIYADQPYTASAGHLYGEAARDRLPPGFGGELNPGSASGQRKAQACEAYASQLPQVCRMGDPREVREYIWWNHDGRCARCFAAGE